MGKSRLLIDLSETLPNERYRVEIKVYEVELSEKYPTGIKARYVLIDTQTWKPRLLIDNHAPFGFHVHSQLPRDKNVRLQLETDDYFEALDKFSVLVAEVVESNED